MLKFTYFTLLDFTRENPLWYGILFSAGSSKLLHAQVRQYNEVVYKIAFLRKGNFIIDLRCYNYFIVVGPMLHVHQ